MFLEHFPCTRHKQIIYRFYSGRLPSMQNMWKFLFETLCWHRNTCCESQPGWAFCFGLFEITKSLVFGCSQIFIFIFFCFSAFSLFARIIFFWKGERVKLTRNIGDRQVTGYQVSNIEDSSWSGLLDFLKWEYGHLTCDLTVCIFKMPLSVSLHVCLHLKF